MSTLKVNDIQEATSGGAKIWPLRAWTTYQMDGTASIHDDGNTSSITDNGTGNISLTWSNAFSNTNYCVTTATDYGSGLQGLGAAYDAGTNDERSTTVIRQLVYIGGAHDTRRGCIMVVSA